MVGQVWVNHYWHALFPLPNSAKITIIDELCWSYKDPIMLRAMMMMMMMMMMMISQCLKLRMLYGASKGVRHL